MSTPSQPLDQTLGRTNVRGDRLRLRAHPRRSVPSSRRSRAPGWWIVLLVASACGAAPLSARPLNDNFANARAMASSSNFSLTAGIAGATLEPGEPGSDGSTGTIWFRWTAPVTGVATFEASGRTGTGTSVAPGIRIGQGTAVANLPLAGVSSLTNPSRVILPVRAGEVYHIQLQPPWIGMQTATLNLRGITPINGPEFGVAFGAADYYYVRPRANDNFAAAADIAVRNAATGALVYPSRFSVTASMLGTKLESGEPGSNNNVGTVWFRWIAPVTGVATFEASGRATTGTSVAPDIRIGQGTAAANLPLAGVSSFTNPSRVILPVRAGEVYQIQLQPPWIGMQTATLNLRGITPINGTEFGVAFGASDYYYVRPRSNDNFAAAADIAVRNAATGALVYPSRFSVTASMLGTKLEPGEPGSISDVGTVWFRWIAPVTGVATFEASGRATTWTSVAPGIRIARGTTVANLAVVGVSSFTNPSRVVLPVQAGQIYHIQLQPPYIGMQTATLNLRSIR